MTIRRSDIENFDKALSKLVEFTATPIADDRDLSGIIQAFEFTFEQSWKAFQKILQREGSQCGSPRLALQGALYREFIAIEDESLWLKMLEDRNMSPHVYQEEVAHDIGGRIEKHYVGLFKKAMDVLKGQAE